MSQQLDPKLPVRPAEPVTPPIRRAEPVDSSPSPTTPPVRRAEPVDPLATPTTPPRRAELVSPPSSSGLSPAAAEKNLFDYANLCYDQKAYDLSAQQYELYLSEHPRGKYAEQALYRLGESRLQLNQATEAEAAYRLLTQRYKSGDYVGNAAYRLASLAYAREEWTKAVPYFEMAASNTKVDKVKQSALFYKAFCLQKDGKPKGAYAEFDRLSKVKENNTFWEKAVLAMARIDDETKNKPGALANYIKLTDAVDSTVRAEALVKSGMLLSDEGKNEEAAANFTRAIEIKDDRATEFRGLARYGLIENYYKVEDWSKVVELFNGTDTATLSENLRPGLWLKVGNAWRQTKEWRRAVGVYELIDQYAPSSPEAAEGAFRRLLCLNELKDPSIETQAVDALSKLKSTHANSEFLDMCRFVLGEAYFGRKAWKEAAATYKLVRLERVPEKLRPAMLYKFGWAASEANDHGTAISALGQFLAIDQNSPNAPEALVKRGMAYRAIEDIKNAAADFDTIIAKYPTSQLAELCFEQSALIKGKRGDINGMVQTFSTLLERFPLSQAAPEAHFFIGSGLFDQKKYAEALPHLEQARQADAKAYDKDASAKISLGLYHLKQWEKLAIEAKSERKKEGGVARIPWQIWQQLGVRDFEGGNMASAEENLSASVNAETQPLVWYMLSEARLATKQFQPALDAVETYLKGENSSKSKGMLNKAKALFGLGRLDEAAAVANEALRQSPEARIDAYLRLLLGDVAMAKNDPAHAAQIYIIPSQLFDDPDITPLALWKVIQAMEKGKIDAAGPRADLQKKYPNWQPPKE